MDNTPSFNEEELEQQILALADQIDAVAAEHLAQNRYGASAEATNDASSLRDWIQRRKTNPKEPCPVDIRKYGSDLALPGISQAAQTPALTLIPAGVPTPEPGPEGDVQRNKRIKQLNKQVLDYRDAREYDKALETIKQLLLIEPDNADAILLRRDINIEKEQAELQQLKEALTNETNIQLLDVAIDKTRARLSHTPDQELQALLDPAKKRRDDLRTEMGKRTSQAVLEDYEQAYNSYQYAIDQNARQQTYIYDARISANVPIQNFIKEVSDLLVHLAAEYLDHVLQRAEPHMPDVGSRDPGAALEQLKDADKVRLDEIFGTGTSYQVASGEDGEQERRQALQDLRKVADRLQTYRLRCRQENDAWETAQLHLDNIRQVTDSLVRLSYFKRARSAYPHHHLVVKEETQFYIDADRSLVEEIDQAVTRASACLAGEAEEAVTQHVNNRVGPLSAFDRALTEVESVRKKIIEVEQERRSAALLKKIAELDAFSLQIKARSERRSAVRIEYSKLEALLNQNLLDQANQQYQSLAPDTKDDPEILHLYPRILSAMGDDDHLREAEQAYASNNWEKVVSECTYIKGNLPRGLLLKDLANLYQLSQKLQTAWQKRYYDECELLILQLVQFVTDQPEAQSVAKQLIVSLELDEKQKQLSVMKELDRANNIVSQYERAVHQVEQIEDPATHNLSLPGDHDRNLEAVLPVYDTMCNLADMVAESEGKLYYSTHKGKLEDLRLRLEQALRDSLGEKLAELNIRPEKPETDIEAGYNYARILRQRSLDSRQLKKLCSEALIAYNQQKTQSWIEHNQWKDAVGSWETVANDFGDYEILKQLEQVRRQYLLAETDASLKTDLDRSDRYLTGKDQPPFIGPTPRFSISLNQDSDLQMRYQFCQKLANVRRLFDLGRFESAAKTLTELESSDGAPDGVLPDYISAQKTLKAVLVHWQNFVRGEATARLEKIANDPQTSSVERAYTYTRILKLNPAHPVAAAWIQEHKTEITRKIKARIDEGEKARIDLDPVDEQLRRRQELDNELENMLSVLPFVGNQTYQNQTRQSINAARQNLETLLENLNQALEIITDYALDGERWLRCVRQGAWQEVNGKINILLQRLTILNGPRHPQVIELEERVRKFSEDRTKLEAACRQLEATFAADDFVQAEEALEKIDTILRSYKVTVPGSDPFRIVKADYSIHDDFQDQDICYYKQDGDNVVIIHQSLPERKKNVEVWQQYENRLIELHSSLVRDPNTALELYPRVNPEEPLLKMKIDLEAYLADLLREEQDSDEEAADRLPEYLSGWRGKTNQQLTALNVSIPRVPPIPPVPMSDAAEKICARASVLYNEIYRNLHKAMADWVQFDRIHDGYCARLDTLAKRIRPRQDAEEAQAISRYWGQNCTPAFKAFLDHLVLTASR